RPEQATWLTAEQRRLVHEDLARDAQLLGHREHSIMASLKDRRLWLLVLIFFCLLCANSVLTFFAPSIVREAGFKSVEAVGWITAVAYLLGAAGMIWNGAHSDRHQEVRYHFGLAALLGALSLAVVATLINVSPILTLVAMTLAIVGTMSAIPVFWQLPGRLLSGAAAAAGVALINSIANLAGAGAPYMTGLIKTATGQYSLAFYIIAVIEAVAVLLVLKFVPKLHTQPSGPDTFH
ncbi:MAG TPA: MFS transporter, partial [Burkholderiales bacterium]|nr:MFS transporter [Burkholderiales bacterium]